MVGAHPWALELAKVLKTNQFQVAIIDTNREDIYNARMAKVSAYHGSVLSESLIDDLRLEGIGKLLALTSNDEANSLACLHLRDLFDSKELFQLKPKGKSKATDKTFSPQYLRGRYLFGDKINFDYLDEKFSSGAIIKTSKLTEEFNYESYLKHYNNDVVILFIITEDKQLNVVTADMNLNPKPNQSIIAIVPNKENNK